MTYANVSVKLFFHYKIKPLNTVIFCILTTKKKSILLSAFPHLSFFLSHFFNIDYIDRSRSSLFMFFKISRSTREIYPIAKGWNPVFHLLNLENSNFCLSLLTWGNLDNRRYFPRNMTFFPSVKKSAVCISGSDCDVK